MNTHMDAWFCVLRVFVWVFWDSVFFMFFFTAEDFHTLISDLSV